LGDAVAPRHLQSSEAHLSDGDDRAPGVVALFGYAKPVPVNFVGTVTNEIIGMILWITGHT
jgi:hypothetical protein